MDGKESGNSNLNLTSQKRNSSIFANLARTHRSSTMSLAMSGIDRVNSRELKFKGESARISVLGP